MVNKERYGWKLLPLIFSCGVAWAANGLCGATFEKAAGIWPRGESKAMNSFIGFRGDFELKNGELAILRMAGWSAYRIYVNGAFVGYGPARGPNGQYRVDEWNLSKVATNGLNAVAIEVAGYNVRCFFCHSAPSFLQAEVVVEGAVRLATGQNGGFRAVRLPKVQKTNRYTYQRAFSEAYRVHPNDWEWRSGPVGETLEIEETPSVPLLDRIARYPDFDLRELRFVGETTCSYALKKNLRGPSYITLVDYDRRTYRMDGFLPDELDVNVFAEIHGIRADAMKPMSADAMEIGNGHGAMADVGLNDTGFLGFVFDCKKPGRLIVTFDELMRDGKIDPLRLQASNGIVWDFLAPGRYRLENFEPNTFRYAHFFMKEGEGVLSELKFREIKNPIAKKASFCSSDPVLDRIFDAAKESFAQNAVDVFTDCPSRERVGWLCDAFFTARVNLLLTGTVDLENLFFQNFALANRFDTADGMIQSSYPGDWINGSYYANWAMWFVLQLDEFARRGGDPEIVSALRPKCEKLVEFFWKDRNMDGLLERVDREILIEHSRASDFVQDVSYPLNMTWAGVLEAMGRLYGRVDLAEESKRVKEEIRRQSWNGTWFCDHAVRNDTGLRPYNHYELKLQEKDVSETCQYYAFFFGVATPESHSALWKRLVDEFGPGRRPSSCEVIPSAAFMGYYMRLECLSRAGLNSQIMKEVREYFKPMAERTGTLWEHAYPSASCCHAFASHVALSLVRDVLGLDVDAVNKKVSCRETGCDLQNCQVVLPVPGGEIVVGWTNNSGRREWTVKLPSDWSVKR